VQCGADSQPFMPGVPMRNLNLLLVVAMVLVVIWVIARVTAFVAGALLNLLLVVAAIFILLWLVRRLR
jgi:hypothetical protein